MGLFSSKEEIYVGTSVTRAIQDNQLPDAALTGITRAIFDGGSIPDYLTKAINGSIAVRAEQARKYANEKYTHGAPSYNIAEASEGKTQVTQVLSQLEGKPVLVEYSYYGPMNYFHQARKYIIENKGYNPITNAVNMGVSGTPQTYLHDFEMLVRDPSKLPKETFQVWEAPPHTGPSPSRKGISQAVLDLRAPTPATQVLDGVDRVILVGAYEVIEATGTGENAGELRRVEFLQEEIPAYLGLDQPSAEFFQVKYSVDGATKYWTYRKGSGQYPVLDALFEEPPKTTGSFFPFLYFRYNKASEIADKSTNSYKTSKKLAKILGINFDEMSDAINENPDIDDIEQAMLTFAVPANTSNALELRYLFTFFDNWFYSLSNQYKTPDVYEWYTSYQRGTTNLRSTILIQDKRFKMSLSSAGLFKRQVVGSVGVVGTVTNFLTYIVSEYEYTTGGDAQQTATGIVNIPCHHYRKQVADNVYEEIQVVDLKMRYFVYGEYTAVGEEDDAILLIPIDQEITSSYSAKDREELYSRSMHYVFNSMVKVTVKWYEQDWFIGIIQVVGLIISFVTLQPAIAELTLAIGAGASTIIAAAIEVAKQLLITVAVGELLKVVVQAIGFDVAILIAAVALVAGVLSDTKSLALPGTPWAMDLVKLASGLTKAVSSNVSDLMKDLKGEFDALSKLKEETSKAFETANQLLETNNRLSPFVIFGESPDDFYNRTTHSGNVGIAAIDAISSYVDNALRLPKFSETIGGITYGT